MSTMDTDWKNALNALADANPALRPQATKAPTAMPLPTDTKQMLRIEKDRRKGKLATLITGHSGTDSEIADLARILKTKLGVGGSTRDGEILIQGDVRQKVAALLQDMGHKTRIIQ